MILHVFNSSVVSGPERLVLPALTDDRERFMIVNLLEKRLERLRETDPLENLSRSLGLRYAAVPVNGRWDRDAIRRLRGLIEAEKPELVHAHAVKASIYLVQSKRGMSAALPIVSTHHGVRGLPDLKTRLYELFYRRFFLRSFDRVLCVSTEDFETVRGSGIGADKLRLHLNGVDGHKVDPSRRSEESARIRASWLPRDAARDGFFLFGAVGRLSAEKDHDRLLRVLSCVEKSRCPRDWRCLLFGLGDLEQSLRATARRLGLERRIVWMGYRDDVGRELAGLDLLLSFSKAEGLPINLIEAGWAGTPVMSTLVGGVKDLISDESCGSGVAPDEPVEESARRITALLSQAGRAALDGQGRRLQERVCAEFSRARWMARLREIYAELAPAVGTGSRSW
jgi:glycosyltransferase involved in cell wall biosynthesis